MGAFREAAAGSGGALMATRITYDAIVTFEFDYEPCRTWRGAIVAANGAQAARRGYEAASRAFPNSRPRSIVVVLEVGDRVEVPGTKRTAVEVEGVAI
jgi:hypothetical protein